MVLYKALLEAIICGEVRGYALVKPAILAPPVVSCTLALRSKVHAELYVAACIGIE